MNIEEACRSILGRAAADAITLDQGLHWTVIAAMLAATTAADPRAMTAIRDYNKQQDREPLRPKGGQDE